MACDRVCYCVIWLLMTISTAGFAFSLATSYWRDTGDSHEGLFQRCLNQTECTFIRFFQSAGQFAQKQSPEVPEASRLSMIGGVALLAIALFLSILSVCIEKDVHFAMTTIYTIAFFSCSTSMALYTYQFWNDDDVINSQWSWSFMVGWASCGTHGLALLLLCLASCLESKDSEKYQKDYY